MISPLVFSTETRRRERPEVGDLVTWVDYAGRQLGGRLMRWEHGSAWIKVVGLGNLEPYTLGDIYPIDQEKVIDW